MQDKKLRSDRTIRFDCQTERLARIARAQTLTYSRGTEKGSRAALPRRVQVDAQIDLWWQSGPWFDVVQ